MRGERTGWVPICDGG